MHEPARARQGWRLSSLVLGVMLLFLLGLVFTPQWFASRIFAGYFLTVGQLALLAVVLLPVALAVFFLRNDQ